MMLKNLLIILKINLILKLSMLLMKYILWLEKETCEECIEYIVSIMMEPYNHITEPLVKNMSSEEDKYFNIPTNRTVEELKTIIEKKYPNILILILKKRKLSKFWFISKNKEEPRLADRFEENGSELRATFSYCKRYKKTL